MSWKHRERGILPCPIVLTAARESSGMGVFSSFWRLRRMCSNDAQENTHDRRWPWAVLELLQLSLGTALLLRRGFFRSFLGRLFFGGGRGLGFLVGGGATLGLRGQLFDAGALFRGQQGVDFLITLLTDLP